MAKFISLNEQSRTATFDVDGQSVTRNIPAFFEGTIDDYLVALARGLDIEFAPKEVKEISEVSFKSGEELSQVKE